MTTVQNSSSSEEILKTNETPNGQALTTEQLAQIEADKLALQAEYTRNRQALIDTTAMVAKNDPTFINSIKDVKLQNAVVKQLYNFETYEQAIAVLGNDFNAVNDGNGDEDRTEKLERELKLIKYNASKSEVENAIKDFKLTNPNLFLAQDAEDKLRAELQFISGELPANERIRKASSIALQVQIDPKSAAYQVLNSWNSGGGNASINSEKVREENTQKQIEAGRALFGLPKASN